MSQLPPLLRLPPELHLQILSHLSPIDQILSFSIHPIFANLLAAATILKTHYDLIPLTGSGPKYSIEADKKNYHTQFPRIHFLLEEVTSKSDGNLLFRINKNGEVDGYVYLPGKEYTEQEGELWGGDLRLLDKEIREAVLKERTPSTPLEPKSDEKDQKSDEKIEEAESLAGEPLSIDPKDWSSSTTVFFAENKSVSRFTGGKLFPASYLSVPFICPFTPVPESTDDPQEMEVLFEIDFYKDDLLLGEHAPDTKRWTDNLVLKRSATLQEWITHCIGKIYGKAKKVGGVMGEEAAICASLQIARVRNENKWKVASALLKISDEALNGMVWVHRAGGHFLLIKREEWERRAEWDFGPKDGQDNNKGKKEEGASTTAPISYC
ncbi:hypothetical protein TWF481_010618 [Arthrobotrys musiformis]|uniref:F-box domain-containing protein n=1 Tax=Arthrobotrys musiformis TaxID=47236 RepID=A0AAV9W3P0_9PEZI